MCLTVTVWHGSASSVKAAVSSCSVSMSTHQILVNDTDDILFNVQNTDSVTYRWVRISRPSTNYAVNALSGAGWTQTLSESSATWSNGSMSSGGSQNLGVTIQSGADPTSSENWTVQVSDDSGGANPFICSGDTALQTVNPDTTPPVIGDITVSNLTDTQAILSWTTDESATSTLEYGTSTSYGSSLSVSSPTTSHSLTITSLTPGTTYHFRITATDTSGNSSQTSDFVFATASSPTEVTTTRTITTTNTIVTIITPTPTPTPLPDRTPPVVTINTEIKNPYKEPPVISASAKDLRSNIIKIEYSVDDGKSFRLIEAISGKKLSVNTSFKPELTEDGNYSIRVSAEDSEGNVGISDVKVLVIDRLPPIVGGAVVTLGKYVIRPGKSGSFVLLKNVEYELVFSSAGGATQIDVLSGTKRFAMKPIENSGLWKTRIVFSDIGNHAIAVRSIDGAGNKTERLFGSFQVEPGGKVYKNGSSESIAHGEITVFRLNEETLRWSKWDGSLYGQKNPVSIKEGEYSLILPEGIYYLSVKARGYKRGVCKPFMIENTRILNAEFGLNSQKKLSLGPISLSIPVFIPDAITPKIRTFSQSTQNDARIGRQIPEFSVSDTDGKTVTSKDFLEKGGIIAFISTWAPGATDVILQMDKLYKESKGGTKMLIIAAQEGKSEMQIIKKRGEYVIPIYADSTGELTEGFAVNAIPALIFVNGKGKVYQIENQNLSKDDLKGYL